MHLTGLRSTIAMQMVTIKEGDGGGGGGEISAIPEAEEEDAEDLDSSRTVNNVVHSLHLQVCLIRIVCER